ncbi:MAG: helix-turn-helix domain-containing protein [Burkholderiaceae bacterium]
MREIRYNFVMPSQAPPDAVAERQLKSLGLLLHLRRKKMRIAAGSVARAANMSRQTLHRIEQGAPSVTMGAYLNVFHALGLQMNVVGDADAAPELACEDAVRLADYPQLEQVAWHRHGQTLTQQEAFALYERNWRHVDQSKLTPAERDFIAHLVKRYGNGAMLV